MKSCWFEVPHTLRRCGAALPRGAADLQDGFIRCRAHVLRRATHGVCRPSRHHHRDVAALTNCWVIQSSSRLMLDAAATPCPFPASGCGC